LNLHAKKLAFFYFRLFGKNPEVFETESDHDDFMEADEYWAEFDQAWVSYSYTFNL